MKQPGARPPVSVIMIFLDAGQFIEEAIDSVFTQTYDSWELLLVDDGSTDQSREVAKWYAAHHPDRVCYFEHPGHQNRGMSASRNLGIKFARGAFISFLDADDVWLPNTLHEQVEILESFPEAAMVYGPIQYWYGWSGKPEDMARDFIEKLGVPADTLIHPPKLLPLFLQNKAAVPSGMLVHRKAIEQFGAFEDSFTGEYEDQVFCAKLCLHTPVFASSRCWYRYRQHPQACVSVGHATGQTLAARRVFLDWLASYLSRQGVKDQEVWWALKQEYWRYNQPRLFYFLRRNRRNVERLASWWQRVGRVWGNASKGE